MRGLTHALAACALAACALAACDSDLPGDVVGAYSVLMRLEENTCGRAVTPFADGERYAAEVRRDGERGYWRLTRGAPVAGEFDDAGFRFAYREAIELGTMDAGTLGCTVLREEALTFVLDDLAAQPDGGVALRTDRDGGGLRGAHEVAFRPDPGGRCRESRGPLREFERLPCAARYHLDGTPRAPF